MMIMTLRDNKEEIIKKIKERPNSSALSVCHFISSPV